MKELYNITVQDDETWFYNFLVYAEGEIDACNKLLYSPEWDEEYRVIKVVVEDRCVFPLDY